MKKNCCLLVLLFLLISCNNQNELPKPPSAAILPSSQTDLQYPIGIGSSGDSINGLLGYGYDATGFCDTISVRAKVLEALPDNDIFYGHTNETSPTLISSGSFVQLISKINNPNMTESGTALTSHIKSLIKLANKTDSIDSKSAFVYYTFTYYFSHSKFYYGSDVQNYLTSNFKNDILVLSPKELISKYGTHVLIDMYTGTKFEVIYRLKSDNLVDDFMAQQYFETRLKAFTGGTPGIIMDVSSIPQNIQTDEQLIYNSIGSRKKLCGVITATSYNPDSIRIDIASLFSDNTIKPQLISIGSDGILPLYELISDATKKQAVKTYIEKYMTVSSDK